MAFPHSISSRLLPWGREEDIRGVLTWTCSEWHGANREDDPKPATPDVLKQFVPAVDINYQPIWTPSPSGETIEELHTRSAYVLAKMVKNIDEDPNGPTAALICTHAATFVAICRVLTGTRPSSLSEPDFIPWTTCITRFERRGHAPVEVPPEPGTAETPPWSAGVGGDWDCSLNGYCGFLTDGEERGWRVVSPVITRPIPETLTFFLC